MKVVRLIRLVYTSILFILLFILLLPAFCIPILLPGKYAWTGVLNRIWATAFFRLGFFNYKITYHDAIKKSGQYIFCANHFSYLDIPTMGLNKVNAIFVGKNDMASIPLFGWMYRKLHITVDRNSLKSRYETLLKSKAALDMGKSLMIFPEGGIISKNPPAMVRFKDGAFRAAIEKQIPIVPVTIAYNWIILPDTQWLPTNKVMTVIYHEPIETKGLEIASLGELRQMTYDIIDKELRKQNEDRQSTIG